MKYQNSVFSQILELIPKHEFQKMVNKYNGDKGTHKLKCWDQFLALFMGQIRQLSSIRDIQTSLDVNNSHWYHLNINGIKRSTFSDANNKRDYRIYEDVFNYLLQKCKTYSRSTFEFNNPIRSIDATIIDLCYGLYSWAKYKARKGAIKMHLELEHNSYLPEFIRITDGNVHEINVARQINILPDSIYVMDRGYIDYKWLYSIHLKGAFFVTRAKSDMNYKTIGQHDISDSEDGVISDKDIQTPWRYSKQPSHKPKYPEPLRLVTYEDPETGKIYKFLTNIENMKASTIALIYKQRWQIELFFKWIKQHLKIKSFIGTSKNAVLTQIWVAMIAYLTTWYIWHQTKFSNSLLSFIRILNEALFFRVTLIDLLGMSRPKTNIGKGYEQLSLGFT